MATDREGEREPEPALVSLIQAESLGNLCRQLADLAAVPLRVAGGDGSLLHGDRPICRLSCAVCAGLLRPGAVKLELLACASGARYLRCRIDHQLEPIGLVVCGPLALGQDSPAAGPALARVQQVTRLAATVIEEIAFANYRCRLAATTSVQVHAARLGELLDKDAELERHEETLRASKDLRPLF